MVPGQVVMIESQIPSVTPTELDARIKSGERLVLLDVREDHEREHCRIQAPAEVIDLHRAMSRIADRFPELALLGQPIVIYCHHGVRSLAVAQWLAAQGVKQVINLEGGIDRWSRQVDTGVPRY